MKNKWGLVLLVAIGMMIIGCGKNSAVTDKYTFGTASVHYADQSLYLQLPFDLQAPRNDAEQAYANAKNRLVRFGANAHFQTMVEVAQKSESTTVLAWVDELQHTFDKPAFKGHQWSVSQDQMAGETAQVVTIVYPQKMKEKKVSLTAKVYIWEHQGIIWKVFFQYPTEDMEGADLLTYVEDKVTFQDSAKG